MVALRLTKVCLVIGLLSFGVLAGCQSNKSSAKHDLPAVEAAPAPKPAFSEAAPPPAAPAATVDLPASNDPQPVDVTLNPDHPSAKHAKAVKPSAKADAKAAKAPAASGKRDRTKWYLVVASEKDHAKYLDEYAAYLNKHGVSVTVEKRGDKYAVLSTEGFSSATSADAKALKAKVLQLGKEHSAKAPVWQDAYFLPPAGHKAAPAAKATTKPATAKK